MRRGDGDAYVQFGSHDRRVIGLAGHGGPIPGAMEETGQPKTNGGLGALVDGEGDGDEGEPVMRGGGGVEVDEDGVLKTKGGRGADSCGVCARACGLGRRWQRRDRTATSCFSGLRATEVATCCSTCSVLTLLVRPRGERRGSSRKLCCALGRLRLSSPSRRVRSVRCTSSSGAAAVP
jgi:hypothetical protein